jgi:hypothetical protein
MKTISKVIFVLVIICTIISCKKRKHDQAIVSQPTDTLARLKAFLDSAANYDSAYFATTNETQKVQFHEAIELLKDKAQQLEAVSEAYSIPIDPTEAEELHQEVAASFLNSNGNTVTPVTCYINLQDLINYYQDIGLTGAASGIRIYPAWKSKAGYIICVSNRYDLPTEEKGYYSVEKDYGYGKFWRSGLTYMNKSDAIPLIQKFVSDVRYYDKDAVQTAADRISRFYEWRFIDSLYKQNVDAGDRYDQYRIRFMFGYINDRIADNIWGRYRYPLSDNNHHNMRREDLTGVTFTLSVFKGNRGPQGNPPFGTGTKDYKNRILEVANPCPPQCGMITPTDIFGSIEEVRVADKENL